MNSIRNAETTRFATPGHRPARLSSVVTLFAALLAAVSCSDGGTQPLQPIDKFAGLATRYDSVAPMEQKLAEAPPDGGSAALLPSGLVPSASLSSAGSLTNITNITFAPEPGPFATEVPGCDECVFGGMTGGGYDIGFTFNYYGTNYTKFWIGTNGFVAFTKPTSNGCCHGMPVPVFDDINNMIAVAWVDLTPLPSQISFETRGIAPRRRLIVNFNNVEVFNEGGRRITAQLILYEGTNAIELHTASKPALLRHWTTQAAENAPGTEAAFASGRVSNRTWAVTNDAIRYSGDAVNAIPVALPGGNAGTAPNLYYQGVEGTPIQFAGSGVDADNDELSYQWDYNNDGEIDGQYATGSFTFRDNGTYRARLIVSDTKGGVGEAQVEVRVSNANPVANAGADQQIVAGQTANFSGSFSDLGAGDAPWGWTWNLGPSSNFSGTTGVQGEAILASHKFCNAGSFTAKFTVVDKDGGSGSDDVEVNVAAIPLDIDVDPEMIVLNDKSNGMITVRIFSRQDFDATTLNPDMVRLTNGSGLGTTLARTGGGLWLYWRTDGDVNGDGLADVVAQFRRDEMLKNEDLDMYTTKLLLKGQVGQCGEALGSDNVRVKVAGKPATAGSSMQGAGQ